MRGPGGVRSVVIVGDGSRYQATKEPSGRALLQEREGVTIFWANNVAFLTRNPAAMTSSRTTTSPQARAIGGGPAVPRACRTRLPSTQHEGPLCGLLPKQWGVHQLLPRCPLVAP